jgi:hypothetical protein
MQGVAPLQSSKCKYPLNHISDDEHQSIGELTSTALCPALGGGLATGALPTSCFLAAFSGGFALGLWARPVAFVTLSGFDLCLGTLPPISGQRTAHVVGLNERRAQLVGRPYLLSVPVSISSRFRAIRGILQQRMASTL